ncbi:MAG TPA: divergent polysaccharide deacetylase family protein [Rhizomicrobium sp.]|nr:divergent polysaccharide deacetylase family protein [Rhizomicrobium sp.]
MIRESLIRRLPDIACVVLFGAGLVLCGEAALAGLPKFMDAVVPGMAAQAGVSGGPSQDTAHFALSEGFAPSRHAPQVLYPMTARPMPDWLVDAIQVQKIGAAPVLRGQQPVIAICIDDLGEDIAGTDKAMALPKDVALSFLPYAESTPFLAQAAARKGHLILAHVPMQALGPSNPGPMALKTGMAGDEIARILGWNLARVQGLVGINNHEGSRFTADAAALAPVMATLKARRLFFFDSRTGPTSAVGRTARAQGVMTAERDIFLDDDPEPAAVAAQLEMLARMAKRNGVAIAIGHPKDATLRLLKAWLAQDHGVTLVPLDEAMRLKAARRAMVAVR